MSKSRTEFIAVGPSGLSPSSVATAPPESRADKGLPVGSPAQGPKNRPQLARQRLLFCFSRQDADGKVELEKHLAPRVHAGALSLWSVDQADYGERVEASFAQEAMHADAALLVLSPDFLADEQLEAQRWLLEQQQRQGLRLVPVIWRSCAWTFVQWLRPLQPAPNDGTALKTLDKPRRDHELASISRRLETLPLRDLGAAGVDRSRAAGSADTPSQPRQRTTGSGRLHTADPALTRRAFGYGEPLLDCDRGEQWETLRALVRSSRHELILVPGAEGQAHRFFLDRIELALPAQPQRRVVWVEWERPMALTLPQFPQNEREAMAALAQALDVPSPDRLRGVLHAQLEDHHLVLLHPVINRCFDDSALFQYYREWLPALLGDARTPYRCKLVQPVEWPSASRGVIRAVQGLLGRGVTARTQQRQIIEFMDAVQKRVVKNLPVVRLPELSQLTKKDVEKFLEIIHYGDDLPDPREAREQLADYVLEADANSELILQRLCRELPEDLWPSGTT